MRGLLVTFVVAGLSGRAVAAPPAADERPGSTPKIVTGVRTGKAARPSLARPRAVIVEPVRGDKGTEAARAALREAIARHVRRQGFHVVDGGKGISYRLRPTVLALESGDSGGVEVKALLVALDRKGRVAAMVEGGARAQGAAPGTVTAVLEAQAIEAAARSIAEDLARRLQEAR